MPKKFTIPSIFSAVDKFSSPVKKMSRSVERFGEKGAAAVARLERKFRKVQKTAANVARKTAILGLAIAAPLVIATKQAIDFEKQMSNVATLVDTNTESMQAMSAAVLDTATRVPVAIEDLTAGLFDVRSAGIGAAEAMNVLETSAKLGQAGLSTTAEATNIMTSAMNTFASEGLSAGEIADILFKTTAAGKNTVSQLAQAFGATASIIQSAGVTLADFSAATAALTKGGTPAAQAQTQIRAAVVALQKPTSDMEKIFKRIGVTTEKELIGKFGSLGASFKVINKTAGEMGINTAKAWSSVEAGAAVTSIVGAANQAYVDTLDNMVNGGNQVTEAFEKQLSTASSQAQLAKNNMKALSITVGTVLIPVVNDLIKTIIPIIKRFSEWARENPKTLSTIVKVAAGIAALSFVVSGLSTVISLVSGVMAAFGVTTAIALGPITLIIIAIAATIALVTIIIRKWDEWGAALSLLLGPLGFIISLIQSFRRNWDMIKKAFASEGILGGLKAIGATILDAILMPLQQVLELVSKIPGLGIAGDLAAGLENFRADLGVETGREVINPEAGKQDALSKTLERTNNAQVDINVNDPNRITDVESDQDFVKIAQTSTVNFGS